MPSGTTAARPGNTEASTDTDFVPIRRASAWLVAIMTMGTVLRLVALGHRSFWLDEIASAYISASPRPVFWTVLWHNEGNMALYYVLLRPWLHFGTSEFSIRLLSVIPGVLSIPAIYALGKRLFGESIALLAAAFFAINACAVMSSQEARGYSLLVLGVIVSTYFFVRLIEQPTYAVACGYGLAAGLTLYCHYFGALVPIACAVSLFALPTARRPWRQLAVAALVLLVVSAPVLWMIHTQDVGHLAWVQPSSLLELYHLAAYLAAGSGKAVGAVFLALNLALLALFLTRLPSQPRDGEVDLRYWRSVLLMSGLVSPIVATLLISLIRPVFHHRFLIVCLPAWVLMTAAGATEIRSRRWRTAAIVGVCLLSLASVIISYTRVKEDWRGVARYLIAQAHPEDRVLYYQADGYFAAENYRGWLQRGGAPHPQGVIADMANQDWERQIDHAPRVWLVLYRAQPRDPASQTIDAGLRNRYIPEPPLTFRAVTVTEYRAKD